MLHHLLRLRPALLAALTLLAVTTSSAFAEQLPSFTTPGFAKLADTLGDKIGTPLTAEFGTDEGTMQLTSSGAVYWHSTTGTLAFTDGYDRIALIGNQLIEWAGEQVDPPQVALKPPVFGAIARADCIIDKESGGIDTPNRQHSGADGPGQYFPGTWDTHVSLYRAATGYAGPLSLHSLSDVERVMSYVLTLPGQRSHWTVGGC